MNHDNRRIRFHAAVNHLLAALRQPRHIPVDDLLDLMQARRGHFEFESGLHGTLLLDVDSLCRRPRTVSNLVDQLASHAAAVGAEIVCGPRIGGALIAFAVAERGGLEFLESHRAEPRRQSGLFRYDYLICAPPDHVRERRVFVVDDVINAGSATRATIEALESAGGTVVGLGALLILGDAAERLANLHQIPLFYARAEPAPLWTPQECPLCAGGEPFEDAAD